jgi:feruloyl-CoA synthase
MSGNAAAVLTRPAFRKIEWLARDIAVERRLRIGRAMLMTAPASIDGNELTDKGYINQRAGLERRAALVQRLYAEHPEEDVIVLQ